MNTMQYKKTDNPLHIPLSDKEWPI
jgi:hypothetical protein